MFKPSAPWYNTGLNHYTVLHGIVIIPYIGTQVEDGNKVVWISSPSDFNEGNADSFEAVTHYNADNYAKAPTAAISADTQESGSDNQPEVDTPEPNIQQESSETEHQVLSPAPWQIERPTVGSRRTDVRTQVPIIHQRHGLKPV